MRLEETKLTDISEMARKALLGALADMVELRGGGFRRALRSPIPEPMRLPPASGVSAPWWRMRRLGR